MEQKSFNKRAGILPSLTYSVSRHLNHTYLQIQDSCGNLVHGTHFRSSFPSYKVSIPRPSSLSHFESKQVMKRLSSHLTFCTPRFPSGFCFLLILFPLFDPSLLNITLKHLNFPWTWKRQFLLFVETFERFNMVCIPNQVALNLKITFMLGKGEET